MATRKELVQKILNDYKIDDNNTDTDQLLELLFDEKVAIDTDKVENQHETRGERIADKITLVAGSWTFIICFVLFLILWIFLNIKVFNNLDPYPFILLNLLLSCLAALQAPIIMMSQNRQAKKDSLRSRNDYKIDLKSELILEHLHLRQEEILKNQRKILKYIENSDNNEE